MPERQCWRLADIVRDAAIDRFRPGTIAQRARRADQRCGSSSSQAASGAARTSLPAGPSSRPGDQREFRGLTLVSGHLWIQSAAGEQLLVGAALDNAALIQDEDLVAVHNAAQTMGH